MSQLYLFAKTFVTDKGHRKFVLELEKQFYGIVLDTFKSLFKHWFEPPLLSAMIRAEKRIATMFAKWIVGKRTDNFYPFCSQYHQHQQPDHTNHHQGTKG